MGWWSRRQELLHQGRKEALANLKQEKEDHEKALKDCYDRDVEAGEILSKLIRFPGSIAEYERFMRYRRGSVIIIDTGCSDKGVTLGIEEIYEPNIGYSWKVDVFFILQGRKLREHLLAESIEALVRVTPYPRQGWGREKYFNEGMAFYGLPVRRRTVE